MHLKPFTVRPKKYAIFFFVSISCSNVYYYILFFHLEMNMDIKSTFIHYRKTFNIYFCTYSLYYFFFHLHNPLITENCSRFWYHYQRNILMCLVMRFFPVQPLKWFQSFIYLIFVNCIFQTHRKISIYCARFTERKTSITLSESGLCVHSVNV